MIRNRVPFLLLGLLAAFAIPNVSLAAGRTLGLEVWTDRGDDAVYQPGEAMNVKVRSNDDAHLLVYEIDSEGHVNVLFPWRRDAGMVEGKRTYHLPPEDSKYELTVEKSTGQGFIVAITSREPFRDLPWYLRPYDPQAASVGYDENEQHNDEEGFDNDGRVVGDPYVAMERIRRRVLEHPSDTEDFASSYASYYVQHEVRYPRYLCNDCHRPNRYAFWDGFDPYYTNCSVVDFRVNWNWAWGPRCWGNSIPYYYYVVREDCPPHYQPWYNDHSRFSSWDGYQRWNNLWGGNLVRYKTPPPPVGYVPPQPRGGYNPSAPPPGYLYTNAEKRGLRMPMPIGRDGRPRGENGGGAPQPSRPTFRGGNDNTARMPVTRAPQGDEGQRPQWREKPQARPEPASRPPSDNGGVRREPPRYDPPRREGEHRDPPRQERHESPRFEPPRQERQERHESPRFEPPREHPAPRQAPAAPAKPEPRREPEQRDKDDHHR